MRPEVHCRRARNLANRPVGEPGDVVVAEWWFQQVLRDPGFAMFWLPRVLSWGELPGLLCLRGGGRFGRRSLVERPRVVFAVVGAAVGHQRSGVGILVR